MIRKINRSTYENLLYTGDENDFFSAEAYVPKGVICLMSAARYYELTNFLPDAVDVAIKKKKKINTLPFGKLILADPLQYELRFAGRVELAHQF